MKRLLAERRMYPELDLSEPKVAADGRHIRWYLAIPYMNGQSILRITYDPDYHDGAAPRLQFTTGIPYHPNVHPNGTVSLLMFGAWMRHNTVRYIYDAIMDMLESPLYEYPYNDAADVQWQTDPVAYWAKAATVASEQRNTDPRAYQRQLDHVEIAPGHTGTDNNRGGVDHSAMDAR